jgi:hypothetical protein
MAAVPAVPVPAVPGSVASATAKQEAEDEEASGEVPATGVGPTEVQLERILDENYRLVLAMRDNLTGDRAEDNIPVMREFRDNVGKYVAFLQDLPHGSEFAPLPVKLNPLLLDQPSEQGKSDSNKQE